MDTSNCNFIHSEWLNSKTSYSMSIAICVKNVTISRKKRGELNND